MPATSEDPRDAEQLKLIAVFHFVLAAFCLLGIGFLFLHYTFMSVVFNDPRMMQNQNYHGPPPRELFGIFIWFYAFMAGLLILAALGNLLSGWSMLQREYRMFSLIIAGCNCLQFPFGTILGVFTFIVLLRDSVRKLYLSS